MFCQAPIVLLLPFKGSKPRSNPERLCKRVWRPCSISNWNWERPRRRSLFFDADNAVQNNVLSTRELEDVPLNGRQIYTLLGTTPGSQFLQTQFGASGYSGTRGWDVSNNYTVGGAVQGYEQFTLNGSNITMQTGGSQGTWELAPNVDALQEVNVQTTDYDAAMAARAAVSSTWW
jgi:hypothetical protein